MHRTQILLDPRQHAALKAWAAAEDVSLSALLRRLVDEALQRRGGAGSWADWVAGLGPVLEGSAIAETGQDDVIYDEGWA